jgi:hypothetical protein
VIPLELLLLVTALRRLFFNDITLCLSNISYVIFRLINAGRGCGYCYETV